MLKKLHFAFIIFLIGSTTSFSQTLISAEWKGSQTKEVLNAQFGLAIFNYDVDHYKIEYTSLDVHGVLDTASGLLVIPVATDTRFPMLCYQHGTVGEKTDVPSNLQGGYQLAEIWGALGYITIAPDFLGLGESRGFHPYVHADSEASAAIDLLAAAKTYLDDNGYHYNDQLFVTGYSQGGHAAAALHREIEENYVGQLTVTASAPMSGPYSVSGVMNDFMYSEVEYFFVAYLPYTILSYQTVYGNLYNDLTDAFKPDFAAKIQEFYDGDITLNQMNQSLITKLTQTFGASIPLKMLQDSVITAVESNPNHPFNVALRANDVHEWAPQAPTRLYYCQADDQVTYVNSIVADSVMNSLGAPDTEAIDLNPNFDHGECVQPAMLNAIVFFAPFAQIDDISATHDLSLANDFSIFPNPASDLFFVKNKNESGFLELFDINGKVLLQKNISKGQHEINASNLTPGIYMLKLNVEDRFFTKKIIIR